MPVEFEAWSQVFLGLIEDLQGRGALALSLGQPGEGETITEVARFLGLGRDQQRPGVVQAILGGEHVDAEQDQRLDGLGKGLLGRSKLPFRFLPVPLLMGWRLAF